MSSVAYIMVFFVCSGYAWLLYEWARVQMEFRLLRWGLPPSLLMWPGIVWQHLDPSPLPVLLTALFITTSLVLLGVALFRPGGDGSDEADDVPPQPGRGEGLPAPVLQEPAEGKSLARTC